MTPRSRLKALALLAFVAGVVFSAYRVQRHAQGELRHVSEPVELGAIGGRDGGTSISSRLTTAKLEEGETATFELCAEDPMQHEAWTGAFLVLVWAPETETLGLRIPLDAHHFSLVRRSGTRACMPLGGGAIPVSDHYAMDLVHRYQPIPSELDEVRVWGRISARRPLDMLDATGLALVFFSTFAFLTALLLEPPREAPRPSTREALRVWLPGVGLGLLAVHLVFSLPSAGPVSVLGRGLFAAFLQIAIAVVIARSSPRDQIDDPAFGSAGGAVAGRGGEDQAFTSSPGARARLALFAPARYVPSALIFALAAGAGAYGLARALLHLVPSTGEAPITAYVAWSSGALSFATLGLLTPVAEEIFFRGLVFKALEAFGKLPAVAGSALAFALLHLEQTYGNWGAFSAIAAAGLVFSVTRAATGSTLVPAFAHLTYNAMLSFSVFD